jgi:hypothetical protein
MTLELRIFPPKRKIKSGVCCGVKLNNVESMLMCIFTGSQPVYTKMITDFDEIFSVYRVFSCKCFDKNIFSDNFYFDGNSLKILEPLYYPCYKLFSVALPT